MTVCLGKSRKELTLEWLNFKRLHKRMIVKITVSMWRKLMMDCTFLLIRELIRMWLFMCIDSLQMCSRNICLIRYCFLSIGYFMMEIWIRWGLKLPRMCCWLREWNSRSIRRIARILIVLKSIWIFRINFLKLVSMKYLIRLKTLTLLR